jgi:LacI family transcriptional regulator
MLDAMIDGGPPPSPLTLVPPRGIIVRRSTEVDAPRDRLVARACQFIHEHACAGIDVDDVVRSTGTSRRKLERRFRTVLGRSPHQQIVGERIEAACRLLVETDLTIETIALQCGFSYPERLSAVFKRIRGETPRRYRDRCRPGN